MCTPSADAAEDGLHSGAAPCFPSPALAACSVHAWLPTFRRQALRCEVLHLPPDFLSYLTEDGLFVEPSSGAMPTRGLIVKDGTGSDYGDWSSSSSDAEDASAACEQPQAQPAQQQTAGEQAGNADLGNRCEAAAVTPPALQPLVPESASQGPRSAPAHNGDRGDSCSDSSSDSSSDSDGTDENDAGPRDLRPWPIRFPVLYEEMSVAIQRLGGSVVPKLNWSCPVDALWINPSTTLACSNPEQVVMMLKSSDRVAHDIDLLQQQAQQPATAPATTPAVPAPGTVPAVLALRRWYPALRPEREFRCFVRQGTLLGASQRDISQHFPQLAAGDDDSGSDSGDDERRCERPDGDASAKGERAGSSGAAEGSGSGHLRRIRRAIQEFHCTHIGPRFRLTQYTYDIYVSSDLAVRLLDFNPVGGATSPLLYAWEELGLHPGECPSHVDSSGDAAPPTGYKPGWPLRVVPPGGGVQAGVRAACGMPFDMLALQGASAGGAADMEKLVELMQQAGGGK